MELIYINTSDISLEEFLKFCYKKFTLKYHKKIDEFNKIWRFKWKTKYVVAYQNSECIIINNKGQYIGCLEQLKDSISKDVFDWTIEDIDLIKSYEEEFFDFEKWYKVINIDSVKFKITKIGLNKYKKWIYLEIENKYSHYRSYLINLDTFTNIKKYIRQEKINNLLDKY